MPVLISIGLLLALWLFIVWDRRRLSKEKFVPPSPDAMSHGWTPRVALVWFVGSARRHRLYILACVHVKPQLNYIYVDGDKFLEPYFTVIVDVPEESAAHVLADLLSRRARLESKTKLNGLVAIKAEAPMSELFGYSTSLRSLTQSRSSFKQAFSGYRSGPSMDGTGFEHA